MKKIQTGIILALVAVSLFAAGCRRTTSDVWEDTKSAGRYMKTGLRKMGGKHSDSRQICSRDDFCGPMYYEDDDCYVERDFVPLQDEQGCDMVSMEDFRQPRETPGDPGSSIPGIDCFMDPKHDPRLACIFRNIYFDYNCNLIKGDENFRTLSQVADYMKSHPNTYIFVEGHTDERGTAAYNLALGSRRANTVRNALIQDGVDLDHIFTISYGRERPLMNESHEGAWSQNRRAEFKIYQR